MKIAINKIVVKADRQRRTYTKEGIDSLAVSLSRFGQLHALVCIRLPDETDCDCGKINSTESNPHTSKCNGTFYQLISGERRLIAARQLNWNWIEIIEKHHLDPLQIEEIELDENLQRENLPWQEEVAAKKRIWEVRAKLYGETVGEVAEHVGMSRGSLWEDARLAGVMESIPELASSKNKTQAMNKLRLIQRRMALEELATRGQTIAEGKADYSDKVFLGDCLEIMRSWPDESVHCVITDPPYGIELNIGETKKANSHPTIYQDDHYDIMEVVELAAREAFRLLRPDTHAYFWIDIKAISTIIKMLTSIGFVVEPIPLVWTKNIPGQTNHPQSRWASGYEACLFCRKGSRALLKQGQSNVLHYDVVPSSKKIHPVEKPTNLLRQLIESSTVPGEIVLDCFGGSGSTAEASLQLGRDFRLIEKDPAFHAGILERLSHFNTVGGSLRLGSDEAEIDSDSDEEADIEAAYERRKGH